MWHWTLSNIYSIYTQYVKYTYIVLKLIVKSIQFYSKISRNCRQISRKRKLYNRSKTRQPIHTLTPSLFFNERNTVQKLATFMYTFCFNVIGWKFHQKCALSITIYSNIQFMARKITKRRIMNEITQTSVVVFHLIEVQGDSFKKPKKKELIQLFFLLLLMLLLRFFSYYYFCLETFSCRRLHYQRYIHIILFVIDNSF